MPITCTDFAEAARFRSGDPQVGHLAFADDRPLAIHPVWIPHRYMSLSWLVGQVWRFNEVYSDGSRIQGTHSTAIHKVGPLLLGIEKYFNWTHGQGVYIMFGKKWALKQCPGKSDPVAVRWSGSGGWGAGQILPGNLTVWSRSRKISPIGKPWLPPWSCDLDLEADLIDKEKKST